MSKEDKDKDKETRVENDNIAAAYARGDHDTARGMVRDQAIKAAHKELFDKGSDKDEK